MYDYASILDSIAKGTSCFHTGCIPISPSIRLCTLIPCLGVRESKMALKF